MSKFLLKFLAAALIITAGLFVMSGGHASAASNNCPGAPAPTWGNHGGNGVGQMAALVVHAYDGSDPSNQLNVNYTIKSSLAGGNDSQIFAWDAVNGTFDPDHRYDHKTFATGAHISGNGGFDCNGWSVIGPGVNGQNGNGYVLDCGAGFTHSKFWISHVDNPGGQAGTWSLYYKGAKLTSNVNAGGGVFPKFDVTNGGTEQVTLVWSPAQPWALDGTTTVDGVTGTVTRTPGQHVTFRHTVHNNGPQTATYNWVVKQQNNGGSFNGIGLNSGGNINVGSGNNGPGNLARGFNVPNNAHNGDKYCQRIDYSNANGPGTATQSSPPACVRVQVGGGNPGLEIGCTQYKISNQPHVNEYRTYITLDGTDSDRSYFVAPDAANELNIDLRFLPVEQDVTITTLNYHWEDVTVWNGVAWVTHKEWVLKTATPITYNCLHASCDVWFVNGDGPVDGTNPDGTPHHIVRVDHGFDVTVKVRNDNTAIKAQPILPNVGSHNFSITQQHDDYSSSYHQHATGFGLAVGEEKVKEFHLNSNGNTDHIRTMQIKFQPSYYGYPALGGTCSKTFPIYERFNIDPFAKIADGTNPENPYEADGTTHGISYIVGGDLTTGRTTTASTHGWLTKNGGTVDSHNTNDSYGTNIRHHYDHADPNFVAGDQYCPHVTISPANGYHGPGGYGDVDNHNATANPPCLKVVNEPFFKVYNSSISARNGLNDSNDACSATASNSGLLAGWNDNYDFPGNRVDRGAGTQLSALALLKITGVASAQTDISRSPTDLTFANTVTSDKTTSIDSPSLGGNFAGTPACDSVPKQDPGASNIGGSSSVPATGGYEHSAGDMRVTGGTVSGNTSIFVEGDVYIGNNITYSGSGGGWSPGHTPSFVLVATGNIYIDNNVTRLDGTYIAQPKDSTHGGTIYTCGTSSYQVSNSYSGCNNQLLVNGSFKANHVKLLRTFGSLRDEEPDPAPAPSADPTIGLRWCYHGGFVLECGDMDGNDYRCTNINEPSEPSYWQDNKLCVPKTSSLELAWTYVGGSPLPYCQKWAPPGASNWPWTDNYLCMNQNRSDGSPLLKLGTANIEGQDCTKVIEPSDSTGQWDTGYWLCAPFEDISSADPADSGTVTEDVQWSSCGSFGNPVGGEACLSDTPAHLNLTCVHVNEPIEDSGGNAWKDNYLCVPNSSDLKLYWTHCATHPGCSQSSASIADDPGLLHLDNVKNGVGTPGGQKYPYCTKWDVPPDYKQTWGDNYLCMNKARPGSSSALLRFFDDPPEDESCITISEIADHDGQWQTGYYLCQPPSSGGGPTPTGPPYTDCENAGIQVTTFTCAAEVIRFSPELYLTKDTGTQPQNQGATQYDAITSLPPVL